jgi:hypothetical protein
MRLPLHKQPVTSVTGWRYRLTALVPNAERRIGRSGDCATQWTIPYVPAVKAALNPRPTEGYAIRQEPVQRGPGTPYRAAHCGRPMAIAAQA